MREKNLKNGKRACSFIRQLKVDIATYDNNTTCKSLISNVLLCIDTQTYLHLGLSLSCPIVVLHGLGNLVLVVIDAYVYGFLSKMVGFVNLKLCIK